MRFSLVYKIGRFSKFKLRRTYVSFFQLLLLFVQTALNDLCAGKQAVLKAAESLVLDSDASLLLQLSSILEAEVL